MASTQEVPYGETTPGRPVGPRADGRLYAEDVAAARGVTTDELLSRLREVEAGYAADPARCQAPDCEELLPEGSQRDTCNVRCRQAKARALRGRSRSRRDQEQS